MSNVKVKVGDLFESDAQTLVNTVNTVGVMGKGVALAFKKKFPRMFTDYKERCEVGSVQLGKPYLYKASPKRWVINFPTKEHWRNVSKLADIESGLNYLLDHYKEWGITSLAVPPLGCGLGGLDWSIIGPTLHRYFSEMDIPVELYAPHGTPPEQLDLGFLAGSGRRFHARDTFIKETRLPPGAVAIASVVSFIERQAVYWPVGRVRLQKIAFFLTYAGVDTGLHFDKGSYGPFSNELKSLVSKLVNNGVLLEEHHGNLISVKVGPTYRDAREVHKEELKNWSQTIQQVGDLFLRLPTAEAAELAASVAYSAQCIAKQDETVSEFNVYSEVLSWKKNRKPEVNRYRLAQTIRELNLGNWVNLKVSKKLPVDNARFVAIEDC